MTESRTLADQGLSYPLEFQGEEIDRELPFVIAVVGDFSRPECELRPPLKERGFDTLPGEEEPAIPESWSVEATSQLQTLAGRMFSHEWARLRVLDASKAEVAADFRRNELESTTLFHHVFRSEYDMLGGEPMALILVDYEFSHTTADIELLQKLSLLAQRANCSVIAAAGLTMFGIQDWGEINRLPLLRSRFETRDYQPWRTFRDTPEARHLVMSLPDPGIEPERGSSSIYATATALFDGYARNRCWGPTDTGGKTIPDPTDAEEMLAALGFLTANQRIALALGQLGTAVTAARPLAYHDVIQRLQIQAEVSLGFILIGSQFMRTMSSLMRDSIGRYIEVDALQSALERWLADFVEDENDDTAPDRPLLEARAYLTPDLGTPGRMHTVLEYRPNIPGVNIPECARQQSEAIWTSF